MLQNNHDCFEVYTNTGEYFLRFLCECTVKSIVSIQLKKIYNIDLVIHVYLNVEMLHITHLNMCKSVETITYFFYDL